MAYPYKGYSALEKKAVMSILTTWVKLKVIILSETSPQKDITLI